MYRLHRCLIAVAVLVITLPLLSAADDDKPKLSKEEQAIVDLTNKLREKEGLAALKPNELLCQAARGHSKNMARQKKLDHELDGKNHIDRVKATRYPLLGVGENIASGRKLPPKGAYDLWFKSKLHKENMLNGDFLEIGVGVARDEDGEVYYTQVFGTQQKKE